MTAMTCRFNACAEKMYATGLSGVSTLRWKSWPDFEAARRFCLEMHKQCQPAAWEKITNLTKNLKRNEKKVWAVLHRC
jgi:hypothetical protein